MRALWERGRASAREITDALNRIEPIAHSTVQTLLRKLEAKGAVGHDVVDRTFVYFPRVVEEKVTRRATRDFVDRVFGGSTGGLIAHLIEFERIEPAELERIRKMIDEKKRR